MSTLSGLSRQSAGVAAGVPASVNAGDPSTHGSSRTSYASQMLLDRLVAACTSVLPDAMVIVTGSLALGDFKPGTSDVDLLVLSDSPTDGLVEAVERAWGEERGEFDLRVVRYDVAARPSRRPRLTLAISDFGDRFVVVRDAEEPELLVEFSLCRQLGYIGVVGPVPDEWVDEVGAAALARWRETGQPDNELMAHLPKTHLLLRRRCFVSKPGRKDLSA